MACGGSAVDPIVLSSDEEDSVILSTPNSQPRGNRSRDENGEDRRRKRPRLLQFDRDESNRDDIMEVKPRKKRPRLLQYDSGSSSEDDDVFDSGRPFSQTKSPIKRKGGQVKPAHQDFHCGLPVFARPKKRLTTSEIMNHLLDPELDYACVCTKQPIAVERNSAFIVNIAHLKNPRDLLCDDMGLWINNGNYSAWLSVDEEGTVNVIGKKRPAEVEPNVYRIQRKYYQHKCSSDLHRMVAYVLDKDEDLLNLAFVQYCFDGEEHPVLSRPHGNTKASSTGGFMRTMPSTMSKLREVGQYLPPKFAVHAVCDEVGGITQAASAAQLPRCRQQAADCCRRLKFTRNVRSPRSSDPLFSVMMMCKESEGTQCNPEDRFVRMVTNTPEPMAVLAFDWTLQDLERFCTDPSVHSVLSVDPTFDLGSFHVTVTTYRHLMLIKRRKSENSKHPVMLGPLFIHQKKTFTTYNFFFSQLVGLRKSLQNIRCFGTDGEEALSSALHTQFKSASHLRCFLHFRGNMEAKLSDLGLPRSVVREFMWDVFGNPTLLQEGLVDAENSDALDAEFAQFETVWNEREMSVTLNPNPIFHSWFRTNQLEVVRECMLKGKRCAAGLGSPPDPFYTNDVESKNRVLKYQTTYRSQELPEFVNTMKELYKEQKAEIEKAVAGLGEYEIKATYQNFKVGTKRWFQKTEQQRDRALARLMKARLHVPHLLEQSKHIGSLSPTQGRHDLKGRRSSRSCSPSQSRLSYVPEKRWGTKSVFPSCPTMNEMGGSSCSTTGSQLLSCVSQERTTSSQSPTPSILPSTAEAVEDSFDSPTQNVLSSSESEKRKDDAQFSVLVEGRKLSGESSSVPERNPYQSSILEEKGTCFHFPTGSGLPSFLEPNRLTTSHCKSQSDVPLLVPAERGVSSSFDSPTQITPQSMESEERSLHATTSRKLFVSSDLRSKTNSYTLPQNESLASASEYCDNPGCYSQAECEQSQKRGTRLQFVAPDELPEESDGSGHNLQHGRTPCPLEEGSSYGNPLEETALPEYIQESMWNKVLNYIDNPSSYTKAPGVQDYSSALVQSSSGVKPHFVQRVGRCKYKCDSDCLMFKSTSGMCSHTLLLAVLNGNVKAFVVSFGKSKASVNYTQLSHHNIPTAGKKPKTRRKAASKASTAKIRQHIEAEEGNQKSKRAPEPMHKCSHSRAQGRLPLPSYSFPVTLQGNVTSNSLLSNVSITTLPACPITMLSPEGVALPPPPPPLIHIPHAASSLVNPAEQSFWIMFVHGNISRCQGCRGSIERATQESKSLVLQHREQVLFQNPRNGVWQLSKDMRNTYYHALDSCVRKKYPLFDAVRDLKISVEVKQHLTVVHQQILFNEFKVTF